MEEKMYKFYIGATPIGGTSDYYRVDEWNRTLGFNSSGSLKTSGDTRFAKRLDFLSSGSLTIIGITGSGQQNLVDSTGAITITGSSIGVRTLHFDSDTGTLTLPDLSGYVKPVLSNSSGIAGSALAEQPIGSGIDLYKGFDFVRNLGFNSAGSLDTTGYHVVDRTLHFNSAGYLTVSGVDVFKELDATRKELEHSREILYNITSHPAFNLPLVKRSKYETPSEVFGLK